MNHLNGDKLIVRALRSTQGDSLDVYAFFIPGRLITQIADISRIHRSEKNGLEGFQRKEIREHVKTIEAYLDQGNVLFPNAIILALSPEVEFKQARGRDPEGSVNTGQIGTLLIPMREGGRRVAWIVDGQQRSLALARTKNQDITVPVVAFIAPDIQIQREQFILVNKAKPLPSRLINELLPEVDTQLPHDLALRKIPSQLCNLLNRDPNSPFYGKIRQLSNESGTDATIVDTAIIESIKRSINDPLGALAQYKGIGNGSSDSQAMYDTLLLFWNAVKDIFPEAWSLPPLQSRLTHSAGIRAMGVLMDRLLLRYQNQPEKVNTALKNMVPFCCWTEGVWADIGMGWNAIQNVTKHVRLLTDQLIKIDYAVNQRNSV